jgi:putative FmdB family regulatory protein
MPIYEYFCQACQEKIQLKLPLGQAKGETACPKCKGKAKRIYSAFNFYSKGGSSSFGSSKSCSGCTSSSCDTCR